jgi:hypothetical protein
MSRSCTRLMWCRTALHGQMDLPLPHPHLHPHPHPTRIAPLVRRCRTISHPIRSTTKPTAFSPPSPNDPAKPSASFKLNRPEHLLSRRRAFPIAHRRARRPTTNPHATFVFLTLTSLLALPPPPPLLPRARFRTDEGNRLTRAISRLIVHFRRRNRALAHEREGGPCARARPPLTTLTRSGSLLGDQRLPPRAVVAARSPIDKITTTTPKTPEHDTIWITPSRCSVT